MKKYIVIGQREAGCSGDRPYHWCGNQGVQCAEVDPNVPPIEFPVHKLPLVFPENPLLPYYTTLDDYYEKYMPMTAL